MIDHYALNETMPGFRLTVLRSLVVLLVGVLAACGGVSSEEHTLEAHQQAQVHRYVLIFCPPIRVSRNELTFYKG